MIWEMYPDALDCGISIADFWELSVMEIYDLMQSYRRRKQFEVKQQLINGFSLQEYNARYIATYLNSENKTPHPWDFFPDLFEEEKKSYEKYLAQEQTETARENRKAYAAELKRRREMGLM